MILIIILMAGYLPIGLAAEHREYEADQFNEKEIVPAASLKTININFQEN